MSLLVAWVVFPAVLTLLATGCGLLLRTVSGWKIPAPLVPAAGLALIVVVTGFLTMSDATAELSVPVSLGLAVAGFGLVPEWRMPDLRASEALAAVGVFAVFAAPVVLSGEATFAGYIKLDDTATWMAFTDRVMEHGRSASGLPPSTYEAVIAVNLPEGYPIGTFLPLGVGRTLVGQDVAWLVQPYMALMAAMLALVLAWLARPLISSPWLRGVAAFLAAQPALLFAYTLWGGVKEVAAALLIALLAASVPTRAADWSSWRRLLVTAVAGAALLGVLGAGGAVWLLTILVPAGLLAARARFWELLPSGAILAGLLLILSIPVLYASGTLFSPTQGPLVNESELGNLLGPLNGFQVVGIWPAGDFRLDPGEGLLADLLIALAIAVALIAAYAAFRARAWALVLYAVGTAAGCLAIVLVASPWVDAKALASASPAVLLPAVAGAAYLWGTEARAFGVVALVAIGAGVIWSNVLGYRNVNLAPRDQLAELERIGEEIAGEGPTLTTDSEVYGGRHFLRKGDPETTTDLRRSTIPLVDGGLPDEVPDLDMDQVQPDALLAYRTLVLRRSPSRSRPPGPYRLIDSGRFYDVWQRPVGTEGSVLRHLGLGDGAGPAAVPSCQELADMARLARDNGPAARLAAAAPRNATVIGPEDTQHPPSWEGENLGALFLRDSGQLSAEFSVPYPGTYRLWLGGSVRGAIEGFVDGEEVGSVEEQLANTGEYTDLGEIALTPGEHQLELSYDDKPLSPGSDTPAELPYPTGPFAVGIASDDPGVTYFTPDQARRLCARRWDWVEVSE
ncbi:MAG: hypothetical protein AABM29_03435 [Actinomycetota bacterium]